ncbi:putative protein YhaP [Pseudoalteromonas holothuriae]|uniref:ABC-2 type transporter transmembrane domain-containing protein n=1 Tax=Pseudoalteromonas holothuriae TaxID=2963714 RepID=A0A9W4R3U8_9GAMM|nr:MULTISPECIES: ABC transporter permease [unclassified Pseudoalteromonas]CAH9063776.1 putative protein YhaP [Pseudoalteromonas sp. CIP111951]CAH9064873.1 putative protein YhaP [Pseudoalteromonas sp. CIP111854]
MEHKFKQILLVAKWEFMQFFKWKQELLSKVIMLCVGLFIYFSQSGALFSPDKYVIAVPSNFSASQLPAPFIIEKRSEAVEVLIPMLENKQLDGILLPMNTLDQQQQFKLITVGKMAWQKEFEMVLSTHYSKVLAERLNITAQQIELLQQPITLVNSYLDTKIKSQEQQSSSTAIGVLVLMIIGIFMSFGQIFVSITGEKQQRVTEQLYACMSAQTWIDGKIFGQMLHSLKAMISTLISFILVMAFMQVILKGQPLDLSMINFDLLPWLGLFALLGIYMATAFMAAIASAIDDPNHSGKTAFMILPLLPMIIGFFIIDSPSGTFVEVLSYFPLTAFAVMPMKMALIDVPIWQTLIAIVSTLIGCYFTRVSAGRLFKLGMVMYGKEPNLKQMLRWALKEPS